MKSNLLRRCAAVAVLIIAASVAYYFVIYLPRERTARLEMEQQEKLATEEREREKLDVEQQQRLAAEQIEREKFDLEQQRLQAEAVKTCAVIVRKETDDRLGFKFSDFDAYVQPDGKVVWFGTAKERFSFEKCMNEKGYPLSKVKE